MQINLFCVSSLSMKDAFDELSIAPLDPYIDLGCHGESQPCYIFKGDIHLTLNKPVKIRSIEIKFKGSTVVNMSLNIIGLGSNFGHESVTTFGKMKQVLASKTTFTAGSKSIPWEFAIPHFLPQTLAIKRASISYLLEVVVCFGIKKSLRVSCPVMIRRPILPSYQLIPFVEPRLYKATIPTKFHYEIEVPILACIEQEELVYSVKLLLFSLDKTVRAIKTTLVQVESYRSQPQSNHQLGDYLKHSAQPEWRPSEQVFDHTSHALDPKALKSTATGTTRELTKPAPSVTHTLDDRTPSSWTHPLVLHQPISQQFTASVDSPLLTISHQLHITLTLIHKIDEITIKVPIILSSIPPTTSTPTTIPPTQPVTYPTTIIDPKDLRIRPPSEYSDDEISEKNMDPDDMISEDELSSSEDEVNQFTPVVATPAATTKFISENALSSTLRPPSTIVGTPTTLISAHTFGRPVRRFASALDLSVVPTDTFDEVSNKPSKPSLTIDVSLANQQNANLRKQQASKLLSLRKSTSAEQLISFRSSETLSESDRHLMSKVMRSEQNRAYDMLHNQEKDIPLKGVKQQPANTIEKQTYTQTDPSLERKQHNRSVSHPTSTTSISLLQLDDDDRTVSSISNNSDVAPSLSSTGSASTGTTRSNALQSRPPTPVLSLVPALPGTTILHQPVQNFSLPEEDFPAPLTATTIQSTIASSGLFSPSNSRLRSLAASDSSSDKYETLTFSSSGHESAKVNTRTPSTIVGREEMMKRYMRSTSHHHQFNHRRSNDVLRVKTSRMTRLYDEDVHGEVLDPLPPVPQAPQYNVKAKTRSTVTEYSSDYESNSDEGADMDQSFNFLDHDPHARSTTPLPRLPRLSFGANFASALGVIDDDEQS
ncbi:hypothetical protein BGW37DRAFT_87245 [Umbelopsis sp. PMI_123]|nr:hypothetical protein BGW37DRAFT_87245 [Umbelopsis sp. PMI_123]